MSRDEKISNPQTENQAGVSVAEAAEWYTVADVARKLQCDARTIKAHIRKGRLRASNLGLGRRPSYRIAAQSLNDFIEATQVRAPLEARQRPRGGGPTRLTADKRSRWVY